jgi:hypothetical protein
MGLFWSTNQGLPRGSDDDLLGLGRGGLDNPMGFGATNDAAFAAMGGWLTVGSTPQPASGPGDRGVDGARAGRSGMGGASTVASRHRGRR